MDEYEHLSAIIADAAKSPSERIDARIRRGLLLIYAARLPEAALDFAVVMEDPHTTLAQRGKALNDRAGAFIMAGKHVEALRDLETVIAADAIPAEIRKMALNNAAVAYAKTGNFARAVEIYEMAIADPTLDAQERSMKRLALANMLRDAGKREEARPHFDALLADEATPEDLKRSAKYFRDKP
jgi:tetratricopeptide (TPR) repeat protein